MFTTAEYFSIKITYDILKTFDIQNDIYIEDEEGIVHYVCDGFDLLNHLKKEFNARNEIQLMKLFKGYYGPCNLLKQVKNFISNTNNESKNITVDEYLLPDEELEYIFKRDNEISDYLKRKEAYKNEQCK